MNSAEVLSWASVMPMSRARSPGPIISPSTVQSAVSWYAEALAPFDSGNLIGVGSTVFALDLANDRGPLHDLEETGAVVKAGPEIVRTPRSCPLLRDEL